MKKIKRTIACVMTVVMFLVNSSAVFAAQDEAAGNNVRIISMKEAEQAATIHIKNVMSTNEESLWNTGVKIGVRRAIFDNKNRLECYYFGIKDKDNNDCGYVITGANTSMYPIIEFAEEGESFLDVSIEHVVEKVNDMEQTDLSSKNCKLYYMGDMNYAVECKVNSNDSKIYDITTSDIVEMEEVCQKEEEIQEQDYSDMWEIYLDMSTRNSNPPDSEGGDFITNPNNYESGYQDSKYYMVDGGFIYYNVMTDFSSGGVCAPTAATNLCKYWYLRDPSKYSDLFLNCSWDDVFWEMFELMETDKKEGTLHVNVPNAYETYFNRVRLNCKSYLIYGTNYGKEIVNELDNNRPCHLIVLNHYKYGNHSVVALGYSQFTYSIGNHSIYIRIADGWTNYPSRYVWGNCQGNWNYVVVLPY
ncbi:MAG: hypothetical protein HFJ03_05325 [Lachnospira sp.]|nr:hypothetical protein [Lachnospira sp.]